ncbi:hypothetical protein LAUMK40_05751 [Mycobacterium kansasii]|nr:hypothetical protein LAUMK40_05751 [Mycobacterium kansasii]
MARARISENIDAAKDQVADFIAPGVVAGNGLDDVPH